jgi:hypothetical protein
MYCSADFTCAAHESIFHDVPMIHRRSIPESRLDEFVYSILSPQVDLTLAD